MLASEMVFMSDHITVTQTFNGLPVTFRTFCPVCEPPKVFLFHTFLEISSLALFFNLLLPKLLAKKKKNQTSKYPFGDGHAVFKVDNQQGPTV